MVKLRSTVLAFLTLVPFGGASAAQYQFVSSPEIDLNRVYRIDTSTGEVGACQFALGAANGPPEQANGVTLCYPAGQGAGPQAPSEYALIASHHEKEAGVFRVDLRGGGMSICYVLNNYVVCTPPSK